MCVSKCPSTTASPLSVDTKDWVCKPGINASVTVCAYCITTCRLISLCFEVRDAAHKVGCFKTCSHFRVVPENIHTPAAPTIFKFWRERGLKGLEFWRREGICGSACLEVYVHGLFCSYNSKCNGIIEHSYLMSEVFSRPKIKPNRTGSCKFRWWLALYM